MTSPELSSFRKRVLNLATAARRWALPCLPATVVLASFSLTPSILAVSFPAKEQANAHGEVELFSRGETSFFSTSDNLLPSDPQLRRRVPTEAIVVDTWAASESRTDTVEQLSWVPIIFDILRAGPLQQDQAVAERFLTEFSGQSKLPRGRATVFWLPPDTSVRISSGLKAIAFIAVRRPSSDPIDQRRQPNSQLLEDGMRNAMSALAAGGIRYVGVPRIGVYKADGTSLSASDAWDEVIRVSDLSATRARLKAITFGTWAIQDRSRIDNGEAFRVGWSTRHQLLESDARTPVQADIRLAALIAFGALLRRALQNKRVAALALLAVGVASYGLALGISASFPRILEMSRLEPKYLIVVFAALAFIAGLVLDWLTRFKASDHLEKEEKKVDYES